MANDSSHSQTVPSNERCLHKLKYTHEDGQYIPEPSCQLCEIERLRRERNNARLAAEQNKGIAEDLRAGLRRIREFIRDANRGTTHWAGCEVSHHDLCAIDRVAAEALSGASPENNDG